MSRIGDLQHGPEYRCHQDDGKSAIEMPDDALDGPPGAEDQESGQQHRILHEVEDQRGHLGQILPAQAFETDRRDQEGEPGGLHRRAAGSGLSRDGWLSWRRRSSSCLMALTMAGSLGLRRAAWAYASRATVMRPLSSAVPPSSIQSGTLRG